MKRLIPFVFPLLMACNSKVKLEPRDTIIRQPERQELLYQQLLQIIPEKMFAADSLSFLILPLEASCPSCRDKTLDSIVKFRKQILPNHYIILSLKGGKKYLRQYFKNAGHSNVPEIPGIMYIDSIDRAGELDLYETNPTLYYIAAGRAYRKVDAWPHTVKEDLREFFRGYRLNTE